MLAAVKIRDPIFTAPVTKPDASAIYDQVTKSVVVIRVLTNQRTTVTGSGVILRQDGVIATNHHVMESAVSARVILSNGDEYDSVTIVDQDPRKDISIIKIKAINLPAIRLMDSDEVKPGVGVYTISAPNGLRNSISSGIVSSVRPSTEISPELAGFRVIQFTAPVSPGSSGGALLDEFGRLMGLVFANLTKGQNLNVAIPINYVAPLALQATSTGKVLEPMPVSTESTRVGDDKQGQIDYEYDQLSELKGIKRIFIDTEGETEYRDLFLKEAKKAKLQIEFLSSPDGAECLIFFRNRLVNEPWFSGSTAIVQKSKGEGLVILQPLNGKRPRLLLKFSESKDSWFEDRPVDKFVKMFIKAYKEANRPN